MTKTGWLIVTMVLTVFLLLGGYAAVASTGGPQTVSASVSPMMEPISTDGMMSHQPHPDYVCGNACTTDAQCNPACCPGGDNVCSGGIPHKCICR
jgi:hypothetical protein